MSEERERSVGFGYVLVMRIVGIVCAAGIFLSGIAMSALFQSANSSLPAAMVIVYGAGGLIGAGIWYFFVEIGIKFYENLATTAYNAQAQTRLLEAMLDNQSLISKQIDAQTHVINRN
ncbi:hypothetical protein EQG49_06285 [Periweissella cryptocerci]|uniref:Uncharacterized protein n=1 Tax=Periweissella cryptocerci TaxID=2506420 RepID=A0A4P6YTR6_9LACO|nr:hypothetical protein [Periweissella cryptocerci]QBO36090.1 hypothetical protein EQG49_06285 [Periweissella cryptocerci]